MVQVWNSSYPVTLWNEANMKVHLWQYTQFAQFNECDSKLLVSGVHPGDNGTMGEIAVFSIRRESSFSYVPVHTYPGCLSNGTVLP